MSKEKKRKIPIPDTFVLLFILLIGMAILTWIIPAGQYDTVVDAATGRSVVDPNSFHLIERNPADFLDFIKAIYQGCQNSAGIIFMILLLGAYASIINSTGAISRGISAIVKKFDNKALLAIPLIMIVLSFLGASAVIVDACIAFIPVGMILAKKLKVDPIAGAAIIYLGCYEGWNASFMAATSVQTAQQIAGLEPLSGMGYRLIIWALVTAVTIWYVLRYCKKVRADRSNSLMTPEDLAAFDAQMVEMDEGVFGGRDIVIVLLFLAGIALYIVGSIAWAWGLDMMVAVMMVVAIACGFVGGKKPNEMAKSFGEGVKDCAFSAMIVGVASGLAVLMNSANIIHTIIYGAAQLMGLFPGAIAAVVMYLVNLVFNFFVPSGPAQAAIVMPIMAPLSDVLGISRQVAVLCFQYGDGMSNSIIPTSGVLMGVLGMAKIPYTSWLKFMLKLFFIWVGIAVVGIIVAVLTGYH